MKIVTLHKRMQNKFKMYFVHKSEGLEDRVYAWQHKFINNEYDQEVPQSQILTNPSVHLQNFLDSMMYFWTCSFEYDFICLLL